MEIRKLTSFDDVREAAFITARIDRSELKHGAHGKTAAFYFKAEHSPIRAFVIRIIALGLPKRVVSHLVRHVHSVPFVSSSRPDWFPEHKDDDVADLAQDFNAQALIDMARKRLCRRTFHETRKTVEELKQKLMESDDDVLRELGKVLVPNCIYRCGCPEGKNECGFYKHFVSATPISALHQIDTRYDLYNKSFIKLT